jgi:hypothetical protein
MKISDLHRPPDPDWITYGMLVCFCRVVEKIKKDLKKLYGEKLLIHGIFKKKTIKINF